MGIAIPQVVTSDRASGAQVIDGSLKFVGSRSNYLQRSQSGGNRRTFTWSGWIKQDGAFSGTSNNDWFTASEGDTTGGSDYGFGVRFYETSHGSHYNVLMVYEYENTGFKLRYISSRRFRDFSTFYHIVVAVDTTQTTDTDKVRVYVNGEEITSWSTETHPSTNLELTVNESGKNVQIGCAFENASTITQQCDGLANNFYLIDGQALGPGYFGYTDPLTNTWRPKRLREGDSSLNDGTVWSNGTITGTSGGSAATIIQPERAFNGNFTQYARFTHSAGNDSIITWTPPGGSISGKTFRIWCYQPQGTAGANQYLSINGGSYIIDSSNWAAASANSEGWSALQTIPGDLLTSISLKLVYGGGSNQGIYAIEIDGEVLTDSASYAAFGTNGFYLPMDGNSPIGEDKSGKGNNWTPSGFGGSVALDKATGALPILNTVSGGNYATVGVRTDANAANLVLAVPLVGSATDVSNSVNSGSTTKTLTVTGAVASSAQSNFYGGSWYFDGTDDGIAISNTSQLDFGSDDFTIEMWFYDTLGGTLDTLISTSEYTTTSSNNAFVVYSQNKGFLIFDRTGGGFTQRTSSTSIFATNTWNHFSWTRTGSENKIYVNGNLTQSWSSSITYTAGQRIFIGANDYSGGGAPDEYEFNGYIQDVRIYKGVAKYTSNFIPASTNPDILPDTPSGVSGSSKLAKVTEGAVHFDGTGDHLNVGSVGDFNFLHNDTSVWTAECWVHSKIVNSRQTIFSTGGNSSSTGFCTRIMETGSTGGGNGYYVSAQISKSSSGNYLYWDSNPVRLGSDRWYHLAFVYDNSNNTLKIYVDGVLTNGTGTATESGSFGSHSTSNSSNSLHIGEEQSGDSLNLTGFISNLRIVNGTAVYTSNFTVPTEPLTNITNTSLLCCQSNTSAIATAVSPGTINDTTISGYRQSSGTWDGSSSATSTSNALGHDVKYWSDLGSAKNINKVTFDVVASGQSQDSGPNYIIYYSTSSSSGGSSICNSGCTLTSIPVPTGTSPGTYSVTVTFPSAVTARYVAVTNGNSTAGGTYVYSNVNIKLDVKATNFNPFNTDINTVRGQETGYCTLNPLHNNQVLNVGRSTLSDGNLVTSTGGGGNKEVSGTIGVSSGKWYFELTNISGGNNTDGVGIADLDTGTEAMVRDSGAFRYNNSESSYSASWQTSGDVIGVKIDLDNSTIGFFKNGIYQGDAKTDLPSVTYHPYVYNRAGAPSASELHVNFGQKPFKFPPPDGFQPLNAANVRPETVIARPDQYMKTSLYTGSGPSTPVEVNLGFQPDLVWSKSRTQSYGNYLHDSVRGSNNYLNTNSAGVETENAANDKLTFTSTGYIVNANSGALNESGQGADNMVSWSWKAGGNKGVFNVDDVGYASAADVGMNVGGQNSNAYNTGSYVSQITGTDYNWAGSATNGMFDGLNNKIRAAGSGSSFTWNTSIAASTLRVKVHNEGGASGNGGTFTVTDSNGTRAFSVPNSSNADVTNGNLQFANVPVSGTLTQIVCNGGSGGYQSGIGMVEINGKILVDDGVTPPNVPSIAVTGCSVGTKQGFSILKWTGISAQGTLPHGLTQDPDFIVIKGRNNPSGWWQTWHRQFGTGSSVNRVYLNENTANDPSTTNMFKPDPGTGNILLNTGDHYFNGSYNYIGYAWHDVPGLQKFGSYIGNNNPDGPYVELGFRPSIIIIKRSDGGTDNWTLFDASRNTTNVMGKQLYPNLNVGEADATADTHARIDFLSNGVKLRGSHGSFNSNGGTFIYAAWAEAPAFNLYGAQSNAR